MCPLLRRLPYLQQLWEGAADEPVLMENKYHVAHEPEVAWVFHVTEPCDLDARWDAMQTNPPLQRCPPL